MFLTVCQKNVLQEPIIKPTPLKYPMISPILGHMLVGLCCLMTPGLSKDIQCHV